MSYLRTVLAVACFVFVAGSFVVPAVANAQGVDLGLNYATSIGLGTQDIRTSVGNVINIFLGLLGLVAVVLILYAGFLWMTAAGNEEKVSTAKRIMTNAVIGLVIIMAAFAIVQFVFRAITGETGGPLGGGSSGSAAGGALGGYASGASSALGGGIIDYHYPENGQTDVPRNTTVSITFKRPIALSSVIRGYDDNGTFDTSDDVVPSQLLLNTDVIKLIPNASLLAGGTGTLDDRFDARYADAIMDPAPVVEVTAVSTDYDPLDTQTLVIRPVTPLGSATNDITYRVAIRGGDNGLLVWSPDPAGGAAPVVEPGLPGMTQDGGYNWTFATGTVLDVTPPQISRVVPRPLTDPSTGEIDRNQLLQIWFSEAVDPTTASGILGAGGGFTNILVQARCLPSLPCTWGGGDTSSFSTVAGAVRLGNRYRTAEFTPDLPCEGVRTNSCGEPVYCLPKNVEIRVAVSSATLSDQPPAAAARDGIVDMANNSLDGNGNGTAEGPAGQSYFLNSPQSDLSGVGDSVELRHYTGAHIDLTPPFIVAIDPPSPPPTDGTYPTGPSKVPVDAPITVRWSKVMSIGSLRTGTFDEETGDFTDDRTTVALRAKECVKNDVNADCSAAGGCSCTPLDPPSFFIDAGSGPVDFDGTDVTEMRIRHRTFFTADELGYTEADRDAKPDVVPVYQPVIRAQVRDAKQNCFYPSRGYLCPDGGPANPSCCNGQIVTGGRYVCPL